MMDGNGTKLAREFAYMNISNEVTNHNSTIGNNEKPKKESVRKKEKQSNHRVCHSLEKLGDSDRSPSNSPMRHQGMVAALYGTPLRTPKLAKHNSKRVSDTAVYSSIDLPPQSSTNHYAVTYYGESSDYANICMVPDQLVKEVGSAEGRIELTSQEGKTSPNPRTRSHSFRNSLRSSSFMRFLRRANTSKEASRRSRSDGSFDSDLSGSKSSMLNFRRERSISLPIKCGEEEFHRGPASPEPTMCDRGTQCPPPSLSSSVESPKRFHTIHENSFRVRAPRTVTCTAPAQAFELPKQRTEIETQKAVRCKSRSLSQKSQDGAERCTSMPISITGHSTPVQRRHRSHRHNSSGDYAEVSPKSKKEEESPTSDTRTKVMGHQSVDAEGFVPANMYGKIVAIDDSTAQKPARPRTSKDYAKVKRRSERLESSETEVSSSPVFDLDMSCESHCSGHNLSSEASQQPSVSPEPIYVNIPRLGASERSPCYVNVDFTPPATPPKYSASPQPMELINPLLNYAEVDLSPSGRSKPRSCLALSKSPPTTSPLNYVGIERVDCSSEVKKAMRIVDTPSSSDLRKAKVEPSSEYAQIDVNATAAIQQMCKDRRQNVKDARLSSSPLLGTKMVDRKSTFINRDALLVRDRKGSVP